MSGVSSQRSEVSSQQFLWTLFTLGSVQKPLPSFESRVSESEPFCVKTTERCDGEEARWPLED